MSGRRPARDLRPALAGLVAAALFAGGASAGPNSGLLDACLSASESRDADAGCLYQVYEACLAETGDDSTYGMSTCLQVEYQDWDRVLNDLWPAVRDDATAADARDPDQTGANLDSLMRAQRAWIAFRDAECANTYQRFSDGTIRGIVAGYCQIDMTAARVINFRTWLLNGG